MSAKKPRPRESDPKLLEGRIDRLNELMWSRLARAAHLDERADKLFAKWGTPAPYEKKTTTELHHIAKAKELREKAKKLRSYEVATMVRVRRLSAKLGELSTGVLPGMNITDDVAL